MISKNALVLGAGGFIGHHLVNKLKSQGYWVRGVDIKSPEFENTKADEFIIGDLTDPSIVSRVMFGPNQHSENDIEHAFNEVYQLAADMGGAGYIFTGTNDANLMHNSALINLNVVNESTKKNVRKIFYSSSACIYPEHNQLDPNNPKCEEESAYPANPDSEYGWEKLFSERLYLAYHRNYKLNVRIARFHNIFGPLCAWNNGKEKAPAAICRKIAECKSNGVIDIWGDGKQTRSFLYIDECLQGIERLMSSPFIGPVNIGSDEMVTINDLVKMVANIANKHIAINNIKGPTGVRGRNSDNRLIGHKIGWTPNYPLNDGLKHTYEWINKTVNGNNIHS